MARIFQTGWEHGNTSFMNATNGGNISASNPRGSWSTYSYEANGGNAGVIVLPATYTELYVRFGLYPDQPNLGSSVRLGFYSPSGEQSSIRINTYKVEAYSGGQLDIDASNIPATQWILLEAHIIIDNAVGEFEIKLNGSTVCFASGVDTRAQSESYIDRIYLTYGKFDDLAINDTTGGVNDSWIGDGRISAIVPSGAGNLTQWATTVGSGNHWANVDEISHNDATDYNAESNSGDIDLFALTNSDANVGTVNAITVWMRAQKDDAGAASIKPVLRTGGSNFSGTGQTLSTSWSDFSQIYDENPDGPVAWTKSDVDALEAGAEVG